MTNLIFPLLYTIILFELFLNGDCGLNCSKETDVDERIEMTNPNSRSARLNGPVPKIVVSGPNDTVRDQTLCSSCKKTLDDTSGPSSDDYDSKFGSKTNLFKVKAKERTTPRLVRFDKIIDLQGADSPCTSTDGIKSVTKSSNIGNKSPNTGTKSGSKSPTTSPKSSATIGVSSSPKVRVNINRKTSPVPKAKRVIKKK